MVIVLLVLGAFTWFYYQRNYIFTSYKTVLETGISEGSLVGYEMFGNNVLKVTKDGVSYIDDKGENIWMESYEMKNPTVSVKGDYAAIADMQGNSIYICNTNGVQGRVTTALPVSKVAVSGIGIVAAYSKTLHPVILGFSIRTDLFWISLLCPLWRKEDIRLLFPCLAMELS